MTHYETDPATSGHGDLYGGYGGGCCSACMVALVERRRRARALRESANFVRDSAVASHLRSDADWLDAL